MPKGKSHDRELEAVKKEREALAQQHAALDAREKAARDSLARQSNEALSAAFAKGNFGTVTKVDATRLAKAIASVGVQASIDRLTVN